MTDRPDPDFTLTVQDIMTAGHCARGTKTWFEKRGFDFRQVLKHGVSAQAVWDTGDAQGQQAVRHAMERKARDGK